uniref:Hydroxyproline-rich glycoprotein n=1 Tax=Rhizophora mucronata TaxID=61149 RepID=A0A2P2IUQ4_RHIMU
MRGTTIRGRIPNPNGYISNTAAKRPPFLSSSPFSSSSGSDGRGRGRGRGGGGPSPFVPDYVAREPGEPESDESKPEPPSNGIGHGRGRPVSSSPILPSFSAFVSSIKPPPAHSTQRTVGRGRGATDLPPGPPSKPVSTPPRFQFTQPVEPNLPSDVVSGLPGAGRGKTVKPSGPPPPQVEEESRYMRKGRPSWQTRDRAGETPVATKPEMSSENAVKNAMRILSRGTEDASRGGRGQGRGRGGQGRGRVRGRGRGRGWSRGREDDGGDVVDADDEEDTGLYLGDNKDGEKLAERVGVENMNKLIEGFEEMSSRVLPCPLEDEYLDALDTNFKIEFEPEYLMGEFDQNPDIDEKPPMPVREMLEKVKPFMMAYEGIQSQEEWEEAVKEIMENLPLLKEIVDHYSGPDRVTAKKQHEELERVAKTIPPSAPVSVKQFADHAVCSLQSNPGWGFDKKCQFMDKLVRQVSQHYR